MLAGNYMTTQEIKDLLKSFENQQKFHNLNNEIKNNVEFEFSEENLEVILGLNFDIMKKENVVSVQTLYLQVTEKVRIRYIRRYKNGKENDFEDFFIGEIISNREDEDGVDVLNLTANNDSYISSFESHWSNEALKESADRLQKEEEEFPINADYYPGILNEMEVGADAWYSGCLPGGYIWCGEGCGGSIACSSSKAGVNALDNCCKKHDCCYKVYTTEYKDCYCDTNLCKCSRSAPYAFNKILVEGAMCNNC